MNIRRLISRTLTLERMIALQAFLIGVLIHGFVHNGSLWRLLLAVCISIPTILDIRKLADIRKGMSDILDGLELGVLTIHMNYDLLLQKMKAKGLDIDKFDPKKVLPRSGIVDVMADHKQQEVKDQPVSLGASSAKCPPHSWEYLDIGMRCTKCKYTPGGDH